MAISADFQQRFIDLADELEESRKVKRAALIGISSTTYSNAYNYGIVPNVTSLIKIADYFCVSVDYLLGERENENWIPSNKSSSFAERLLELKAEKGISTIYELSQQTHIHRNNFAQWLKRGYYPLVEDLQVLANYFGVSVDYLLGRTDYKD